MILLYMMIHVMNVYVILLWCLRIALRLIWCLIFKKINLKVDYGLVLSDVVSPKVFKVDKVKVDIIQSLRCL